ncbi:hypothetical protein O3G_MSEX000457 [Manduca sexta]|nr:hypothetical protein O3G_MSEX000457 [Manduca sexta]
MIPLLASYKTELGLRFSKMQTTAGLITILKKYRVELADGTPTKLDFYPTTFLTNTRNALNLKFIPREEWQQRVFAR